jgi:hypothetical protein
MLRNGCDGPRGWLRLACRQSRTLSPLTHSAGRQSFQDAGEANGDVTTQVGWGYRASAGLGNNPAAAARRPATSRFFLARHSCVSARP